ncbi:MAG: response regulator, partial [Betaproteobacteria bacterium]|nr:response regulator [Betaproteobacteria bacterium]
VLLAEDTPINQTLATMILTRMGHEVTVAHNGALAVQAYAGGHFDVVLMDIQMPEMSGVEATQAIRALELQRGTPRVPIIAVTAHALKGDRERYLDAGMNGYVAKPLSMQALMSEMGRCMGLSAAAVALDPPPGAEPGTPAGR